MRLNKSDEWMKITLQSNARIRDAIQMLDQTSMKVILVVGKDKKFIGTLSDGDIRRGILSGVSLDEEISHIYCSKAIVAGQADSPSMVRAVMERNKIYQIPVISSDGRVVGLHTFEDLVSESLINNYVVIMAGGLGVRMRPLTTSAPKPMLNIGDKPILKHIVDKLKRQGFQNIIFVTNYLQEVIVNYFGDGSDHGVNISYIQESKPMGTAGAISLLAKAINDPFIVTNGDVLSDIGYDDFLSYHLSHGEIATMAVKLHQIANPFGVVDIDLNKVMAIREKPIYSDYINAGIYALSQEVFSFLNYGEQLDMTDLLNRIIANDAKVISYHMSQSWMDIGRPEDLHEANRLNNIKNGQ